MTRKHGRSTASFRRGVIVALSALMVGSLLQATVDNRPAVADDGKKTRTELPVEGGPAGKAKPRTRERGPRVPQAEPKAAWPKAGSARVKLDHDTARRSGLPAPIQAGNLPLSVGLPETVRSGHPSTRARAMERAAAGPVTARVLSRKATKQTGVKGLLFTLAPSAEDEGARGGLTRVRVDYAEFADAYGGNWASRMRLVRLPECSLTTPAEKGCSDADPIETTNNTEKQTLTAGAVPLRAGEPTVLAAVADEQGIKGSFAATKLASPATWNTNLNTGDFSWSYDMPAPEVPGGFKPSVSLSYSSGQIDGRTGGTNNQASWIGDGFHMWPGYIERRYKPCSEDDVEHADGSKPGDQCWKYDNAFLTFNGVGGELVPVGDDEWKLKADDGTRIKRLTSTARANGDDNNEYWRLTTPDGARYYFGYHRLPGWTSGDEATNSTWTVPVFGNDSGEPCHASAFEDSWCHQAWRWNLDYAVDTHGNAIAFYYDAERNAYGRNLEKADDTRYTRGGTLDRIEYGLRSASIYETPPLAKVDFTSSERCLPQSGVTCAPDTIDTQAYYWYDTPWDLNCEAGSECDQGRFSPSFWTRKRLTGVTTYVRESDTFEKVDSWQLKHRWGMADVDYQLLLDSVQHTGHTAEPALTLPKTTFAYTQLENRLDVVGDGYAPFVKERLSTVADEYGGQVDVNYSAPACTAGDLPTPETNTTRCFPQLLGGYGTEDPDLEWFNKYVVTSVTATDRTGGAPDQVTRYTYLGGAAWHYDENGLVEDDNRTWSQWRGYGHVKVEKGGQTTGMKSREDTYFLRGMHGDRKTADGGTKDVSVTLGSGEGDPITDHRAHAGFVYKTATYTGPGGNVLVKTVNRPWRHETGSKTHSWGTLKSHFTGTAHTKTWTSLDKGAGNQWRITSKARTYDTIAGRLIETNDYGDNSTAADNQCSRTTFASDASDAILNLPSRQETVAGSCADTPDRAKDVVSDLRTAYDGKTYGQPPATGDATATAVLQNHDGTTATYLESGATFDSYGRTLTATDLTADVTVTGTGSPQRTPREDGRTTTTAYSPATGFPTKVTTTTPPARDGDTQSVQTTVREYDPRRAGLPVAEVDTNGKTTTVSYDALGRTSKVWLPHQYTNQLPYYQFEYLVEDGKPTSVATRTLSPDGGNQITAYTLYDGFLRARQTQKPGPDGGRILTDTFYDARGLTEKSFAAYYTEGAPARTLFEPDNALSVQTQAHLTHDGLGRTTETQMVAGNGTSLDPFATTTTMYGGDRTTVIPPQGETATTTLSDARDRITELRQHHARAPEASYDTTSYTYNQRGQLAKVTDPAGNAWTYSYDQLGRTIRTEDPDKGTITTTYDDRGNIRSTTDARGIKLVNIYDGLNRRTELREDSATGELRAEWTYDTIYGAEGHLAEATRYVNGNPYTYKVTQYDRRYHVKRAATIIPESEGALAGTYHEGTAYHTNGLVAGRTFSAIGSLPGGGWTYTYEDQTLRPIRVYADDVSADISYYYTGQPSTYTMGETGGATTQVTNTYEWGTRRLATSRVDREGIAGVDRHNTYSYDPAGNLTSVADVSRSGTDTQCFDYDHLRRLTEAWTQPTTTCAASPVQAALGGPAPYWHSYTYDKVGNRLTETQHDPSGDTAQDLKRTYTYPDPGSPQPHTLTSVTSTGPTGTAQDTFQYDKAGNTTTRVTPAASQKLTWTPEGRLHKVMETAENGEEQVAAEYIYDAQGNRLIARTPEETTLYLGDYAEITVANGSTTPKATRYVPLGSGHQAVLADNGDWTITVADHNGTGQLAVDAETMELTQRRSLPFGGPRGTALPSWPGSRGFVGGTDDTEVTGLIHLGAREYDPTTGRFLSVDPIMDLTDSQQIHGYTYANNSPLTFSDPDGLVVQTSDGLGRGIVPDLDGHGTHLSGRGDGHGNAKTGGGSPTQGGSSPPSGPVITVDAHGATYVNGQRIPKERELSLYGGPNDTYQEKLGKWTQSRCREPGDQGSFCDAAEQFGWISFETTGDILEVLGIRDAIRCAKGSANGCMWLAAGLTPFGKAAKLAKLGRASKGAKGGRGIGKDCNSFLGGTLVLLADGSSKPIEDLKIGDKVLATDPTTGETRAETITAEIIGKGQKRLVRVSIDIDGQSGSKTATVTATNGHPFWVPGLNGWLDATDLNVGQLLRTTDGTRVRITGVERWTEETTVHNLTVADLHTYYVLAGATPVLVHNSGPDCGVPTGGRNGDRLGGEDFHGSDYSLDEMVEFVNGHTGGGNPAMGRPSATEVETTLRQAGPRQLDGQNSSRFDHNGVRVIINWDMPWKSTSYYPGR